MFALAPDPSGLTLMATALEEYFARSLGFALLSIGLMVVLLSGAVPLVSRVDGKTSHPSKKKIQLVHQS